MVYGNNRNVGFGSKMTRKEFGKAVGLGAAGVAAGAMGLGGVAHAIPVTHDVYPTGSFPTDKIAVQNAIDSANPGDTILLHATATPGGSDFTPFNMGPKFLAPPPAGTLPTITITKPLKVQGEVKTINGVTRKTCINGGYKTFFVDNDATGPVDFDTLESHGANYYFLFYNTCNGANIEHVDVYDVYQVWDPTNFDLLLRQTSCINFGSPTGQHNKLIGSVLINDCILDNTNTCEAGGNQGIIYGINDTDLTISGCHFFNFGRAITLTDVIGDMVIQGNEFISTLAAQARIVLGGVGSLQEYYLREAEALVVGGRPPTNRKCYLDFSNNTIDINPRAYKDYEVRIVAIELADLQSGSKIEYNPRIYTSNENNKDWSVIPSRSFFIGRSSGVSVAGNTFSGNLATGIHLGFSSSSFSGNYVSGLTTHFENMVVYADSSQINGNLMGSGYFDLLCFGSSNDFVENIFGPQSDMTTPAITCYGNGNNFIHNDFKQSGLKGFKVSSTGVSRAGCIFLNYGSTENTVEASVSNDLPDLSYPWYDVCTQVADGSSYYVPPAGISPNTIILTDFPPELNCNSFENCCISNQYDQMVHMLTQYGGWEDLKIRICTKNGGTWDTATNKCIF